MPMVRAPSRLASRRHASVNGVVPLAATAISTSSAPTPWRCTSSVACRDLVLGALHRAHHGLVAAGDQQQQALRRPAEGRHQLGAILDRQAAGGAGTGVDQATAVPQTRFHRQRRSLECRSGRAHRGHGGELPLDHRIQDVRGVPDVDAGISWAWAFRFHRAERQKRYLHLDFTALIHK